MKRLCIIRHAKSSWAQLGQSDFERPLNDRGNKDAPEMAQRLKDKKIEPDALVSSPALRTRQTATHFLRILKLKEEHLNFEESLYHASPEVIAHVVGKLDDSLKTVAIFAHNPGITDFANLQSDEWGTDNMPTCGMLVVEADVERWKDFEKAEKKILFFDYPKNH